MVEHMIPGAIMPQKPKFVPLKPNAPTNTLILIPNQNMNRV